MYRCFDVALFSSSPSSSSTSGSRTHAHASTSSFVFLCPHFSLSLSSHCLFDVDSRFSSSSSLSLRACACVLAWRLRTFFVFSPSSSSSPRFFAIYNANIMSADRQSTTTCFTQLEESNGSSGNISSKNRNITGINLFPFSLQYNLVRLLFVL